MIEKISIILPVRNEAINLKFMIPIFDAVIEIPYEILVVYDFPEDNSVEIVKKLQQKYPNTILVFNELGPGVPNAIKKAVSVASSDIIFITAVDELFSMSVINDMLKLIDDGFDLVNTTRYTLDGKNIRDSLVEKILSFWANKLFQLITGSILTDATSGIKMLRKAVFDKIDIEATPIGWAVAFEIAVKAEWLGLKIAEVPIVSIDRLFGGKSTFSVGPWIGEYFRWFIWGVKRMNRFSRIKKSKLS